MCVIFSSMIFGGSKVFNKLRVDLISIGPFLRALVFIHKNVCMAYHGNVLESEKATLGQNSFKEYTANINTFTVNKTCLLVSEGCWDILFHPFKVIILKNQ